MSKAIALPFSFTSSASGVNYTESLSKTWQDRVVLVVMTKLGERVMRPNFGSQAGSLVFENMSTALVAIKQAIGVAFGKWLPELILIDVTGVEDTYDNILTLTVTYKYNQNTIESVTIKTALIDRSGNIILEVNNG
jgi:phage baseplate assembly protein W